MKLLQGYTRLRTFKSSIPSVTAERSAARSLEPTDPIGSEVPDGGGMTFSEADEQMELNHAAALQRLIDKADLLIAIREGQ